VSAATARRAAALAAAGSAPPTPVAAPAVLKPRMSKSQLPKVRLQIVRARRTEDVFAVLSVGRFLRHFQVGGLMVTSVCSMHVEFYGLVETLLCVCVSEFDILLVWIRFGCRSQSAHVVSVGAVSPLHRPNSFPPDTKDTCPLQVLTTYRQMRHGRGRREQTGEGQTRSERGGRNQVAKQRRCARMTHCDRAQFTIDSFCTPTAR
jgi:hypothetical protein